MSNELHKMLKRRDQNLAEYVAAEIAVVSTDASDEEDDVYVTLPNSEAPRERVPVHWRPSVTFETGTAQPRYPQRGDRGAVIYLDTGELWLMW